MAKQSVMSLIRDNKDKTEDQILTILKKAFPKKSVKILRSRIRPDLKYINSKVKKDVKPNVEKQPIVVPTDESVLGILKSLAKGQAEILSVITKGLPGSAEESGKKSEKKKDAKEVKRKKKETPKPKVPDDNADPIDDGTTGDPIEKEIENLPDIDDIDLD